jgi:hypothetical protein
MPPATPLAMTQPDRRMTPMMTTMMATTQQMIASTKMGSFLSWFYCATPKVFGVRYCF